VKVLVTGVTGFFGGRIARGLADAGHTVRGLVRPASRWEDPPLRAESFAGDTTDESAVRRAVDGCDAVVHAAAFVKVWTKDRSAFDRVNVGGLENVAGAAREKGVPLHYVSSFIALGPTDGTTFDEETPRAADHTHNDYERTKRDADLLARRLAAGGQDLVRIYPGVLYGPGAITPGNHVVVTLLQHARGKLPGTLGPGDRRLCLTFVEDAVAGVRAIVERRPPSRAYVLGGDNRTLVDLFDAFARASGIAPPGRRIPYGVATALGRLLRLRADWLGIEPELTDEVVGIYRHEWAYSSARAQRELGYRITPLEEGMERTVAWLRQSGRLPGTPR
jgi:farnesol dehydrogenase